MLGRLQDEKSKVEKLTDAAFSPFGPELTAAGRDFTGEAGMYQWYEKQSSVDGAEVVSVNLLTAIEREFLCKKFEAHGGGSLTFLSLLYAFQ